MVKAINSRRRAIIVAALIAIIVSFILVLVRVLPIGGPSIFSDEYLYAAWAAKLFHGGHGIPPLDVSFGNWLYFRIYSIVFVGVGSFLEYARALNCVFAGLAAGALVVGLRVVNRDSGSVLLGILAVGFCAGLLGTYAAYFIPETLYFALTVTWLLASAMYARNQRILYAIAIGVAGAAVTMTKGQGLLLLPCTVVMCLSLASLHKGKWGAAILKTLIVVVVWLVGCAVANIVLRNDSNLNLIGGFYGGWGAWIITHLGKYLNSEVLHMFAHYCATLILVLGLPMLICAWLGLNAVYKVFRCTDADVNNKITTHIALPLSCAACGFIVFGSFFSVLASTPGTVMYDPFHSLGRLDGGRYFEDFALLGSCVGIVASKATFSAWSKWIRTGVYACFLIVLALSTYALHHIGWQNPNDFAIAYGLFSSPSGRVVALALSALAALVALAWPGKAPILFACALIGWLGFSSVRMEQLRWRVEQPAAGRVAEIVAAAGAPRATVEIVGPGATVEVYRAGFLLLDDRVRFALGDGVSTCDVDGGLPDWVVALNGKPDPCGYRAAFRVGDAVAAYRDGEGPQYTEGTSRVGAFGAKLSLRGTPTVAIEGASIQVHVLVENTGEIRFGSASEPHNVNLGAHSIDASGGIIDNDLARGHLPQVTPGGVVKASILLPVARVLGHRAEILPVEEGVAWFNKWGTKPVIVGPFRACSHLGVTRVCGADGKPLPQQRQ